MKDTAASPLDIFQLHLGDLDHAFLLSVSVKLSGIIDEKRLRQAADRAAAEMPILVSRYAGDLRNGRFVRGEESIPITITTEHPDRVMTALSSYAGPLFRITICRNTTDTIVFSAAHLLTDARGVLSVAARIAELFREPASKMFKEHDRTLSPAFRNFSAEKLQELFSRERDRFPAALADKKYFTTGSDPEAELTIVREQLSPETLAGMKTFAKSHGATIHDLLTAAYGTALRDWLAAQGILLDVVPLCSTADLRRYFPEDERGSPMNYTVAYWSPVHCGRTTAETLTAAAKMSQDIKQHAIGIGAARPFAESILRDDDIGTFAGVPFLTNPGVIPSDTIQFGDDISVEELEFQGVIAGGSAFTAGAWTYNNVLHLSSCAGADADTAAYILRRTAEILFRL